MRTKTRCDPIRENHSFPKTRSLLSLDIKVATRKAQTLGGPNVCISGDNGIALLKKSETAGKKLWILHAETLREKYSPGKRHKQKLQLGMAGRFPEQ